MVPLDKLDQLLPPARLQELAVVYKVDAVNQVRLPGRVVFLCLLLGLLHHRELTQRILEETSLEVTGRQVDHSSFGKRLEGINPAFFAALFTELYSKLAAEASAGEKRALRLRFVDATTVTLSAKLLEFGLLVGSRNPDKAHRHVKSILELSEEGLPNFLHLCTQRCENADSVALGVTMAEHSNAGDLWIFDKGCHGRERLLALQQRHAFFLTPHTQQNLGVRRVVWQADPALLPTHAPEAGEPTYVPVRVETAVFQNSQSAQNAKWEALPLVVVHGLRFDVRSRSWKALVLMTNLPLNAEGTQAGPFTFLELALLYRQRWAIEVFFKFVKQHLSYSHLTSRSENGIRVMLYMSLIAALLLIWYKAHTRIDRGWRSVKFWLAHDVLEWTRRAVREALLLLGSPPLQTQRE